MAYLVNLSLTLLIAFSCRSIDVTSEPSGAEVFFDDHRTGEKISLGRTPLSLNEFEIEQLPLSSFALFVEKEGFSPEKFFIIDSSIGNYDIKVNLKNSDRISKNRTVNAKVPASFSLSLINPSKQPNREAWSSGENKEIENISNSTIALAKANQNILNLELKTEGSGNIDIHAYSGRQNKISLPMSQKSTAISNLTEDYLQSYFLIASGSLSQAENKINQMKNLNKSSASILFLEALLAFKKGNSAQAKKILNEAKGLLPENAIISAVETAWEKLP